MARMCIEDNKHMTSIKRKLVLRRLKTGCFYLISSMLSILNNVKGYCLANPDKPFDRVLLISLRHIGDFVWATSVIRELSVIYPTIKFDVVVHPANREIASLCYNVRNVIVFKHTLRRAAELSAGGLKLDWSNLKNVLKEITSSEYDGLIVLSPDTIVNLLVQTSLFFKKRSVKVCDISWWRLHSMLTGTKKKKHELDIYKQVIAPLAKDGKIPELIPVIEMPETDRTQGKSYSNDHLKIGFSVGAGWKYRRWSMMHFLNLANLILQEYKNSSIIVYGGDSEEAEVANFIKHNCRYPERVETFVNKGMMDFLKSLQRCDLVISNDSGPAHISSALGVPVIVIFGPQVPQFCQPRGLSTVKVFWKKVECSPCDQSVCIIPEKQKCMDSVIPAEVFNGVKEIIHSFPN
jgi:ADP-heptose:LPS heptosyltransferase